MGKWRDRHAGWISTSTRQGKEAALRPAAETPAYATSARDRGCLTRALCLFGTKRCGSRQHRQAAGVGSAATTILAAQTKRRPRREGPDEGRCACRNSVPPASRNFRPPFLCFYCDRHATRFNKVDSAARKRFAGHKKELQAVNSKGNGGSARRGEPQRACRLSSPPLCGQGILPTRNPAGRHGYRGPRRTHLRRGHFQ